LIDIIKLVGYLEIFINKAKAGNSNIGKIYSAGRATIVKGGFIIIINIKKKNFIIEFDYNNINNIKKKKKKFKKN